MSVDFWVLYYIRPGPVQYTIYWTSLLTKANSVNKNVKYNMNQYTLYLLITFHIFNLPPTYFD